MSEGRPGIQGDIVKLASHFDLPQVTLMLNFCNGHLLFWGWSCFVSGQVRSSVHEDFR
jgi:hypothetical protein